MRDPHGYVTQAGPYFRSRHAHAGDGILGGKSAGYWVTVDSTGQVRVRCLNPNSVVAFSVPVAGFDDSGAHRLRADATGVRLRVWLDGQPVAFDQAGRTVTEVDIPALWKGKLASGSNQGAAGLAFICQDHHDCRGSESASGIRVTVLPQ